MSELLVPVIIGVGDIKNPSENVADALEPAELMFRAVSAALEDSKLNKNKLVSLKRQIDSIQTVNTWTWPYPDLPGLLAQKLDIQVEHKHNSPHGGNQPAKLVDEAARRIAKGQSITAVVTGGEALASLGACIKNQKMPPPGWTKPDKNAVSMLNVQEELEKRSKIGHIHKIGGPIQIYPLYENGFRAWRKQSIADNHQESCDLYGEFAKVAASNPEAWFYGSPSHTAKSIGIVSKKNRMICFPYPLLMNAFNTVNMSCAVVLTSTKNAAEMGIPESHWIYPLGGAGTNDSEIFLKRPNFHSSPSITKSIDAALDVCDLESQNIDLFDLYSCFPIVPKIAACHLELPLYGPKPLTLLGGLTSFGGAGNNYSLHAITEMTRQLRSSRGNIGLILANGGVMTHQHVLCLSTHPRSSAYPERNPLPEHLNTPPPPFVDKPEGKAVIETYTVDFSRSGAPERGHVIGRVAKTGSRFLANHADEKTLKELADGVQEPIGRSGWVKPDPDGSGRNLFGFGGEKL